MTLDWLDKYIIIITIIGFVACVINSLLYRFTEEYSIDLALTILSLLGGSLGIIVGLLLFERDLFTSGSAKKTIMMSRVFVICVCIIQMVAFLYLKGFHSEVLYYDISSFFINHKALLIYLLIVNVIAFVLYAIDKTAAINKTSRIRIVVLLGIALIGGSIGALIAMYLLRHKTSIDYFVIGVPLILIMQVIVIFYLMNAQF